jgi:hypothetical protein
MIIRRPLAAVVALPAAVLVTAALTGCQGSVGAGIQVGPVRLAHVALPGHAYRLPAVWVANTGSGTETITARLDALPSSGHTRRRIIPPSWVHATSPIRLAPSAGGWLHLILKVPSGARPGWYYSDIAAEEQAGPAAGGLSFGGGGATLLFLRVGTPPRPPAPKGP